MRDRLFHSFASRSSRRRQISTALLSVGALAGALIGVASPALATGTQPSETEPTGPSIATVGDTVTYFVWVTDLYGDGVPSGTVAFLDNGNSVGCDTATLYGGPVSIAQCTFTFTTAGSHTITTTYSGDATYAPSGGSTTVAVKYVTTTGVSGSSSAAVGGSVIYTAIVTDAAGDTDFGGTVTFSDSGSSVGCDGLTVTPDVGNDAKTASCDVTFTTVGSHTITATYSGDGSYATSSDANGVVVNVRAPVPARPPSTVTRVNGIDRFGTAVAISQSEFPTARTAGAVVITRADDYADAMVGVPLAAAKHGPMLLADGGTLTAATQAEIVRVLPAGATVYIVGGTAAVPASVASTLSGLGFTVQRYYGADRYGTALAVADALGDPGTVLLVTGRNFADALTAGPAAAHVNGAILLTDNSALPAAVAAYLSAHKGTVYAVGGPAAQADPSAIALVGADRYATGATVAATLFVSPSNVGIATGLVFPDALTGGAAQALAGGPLLLTAPTTLPTPTSSYLTSNKNSIMTANIFGGASRISAEVSAAVGIALGL